MENNAPKKILRRYSSPTVTLIDLNQFGDVVTASCSGHGKPYSSYSCSCGCYYISNGSTGYWHHADTCKGCSCCS